MVETTSVYGGRATISFHSGRSHYYTVTVPRVCTDLFQPSVTSAIGMLDKSGALTYWAVDCFQKKASELIALAGDPLDRQVVLALLASAKDTYRTVKDEAAKIGSLTHARLEYELLARGGPQLPGSELLIEIADLEAQMSPDMLPKANAATDAGKRFFDEHKIEVIQSEAPRWSPTYGYVGTGDLIAKYDGELAVLDYKTGKRLYPSVRMQLAAYQQAYDEEFEAGVVKRVGVNVCRDGALDVQTWDNDSFTDDFIAFRSLLTVYGWNEETKEYNPKPRPRVIGWLNRAIARAGFDPNWQQP